MNNSSCVAAGVNTIVVMEDSATRQRFDSQPYPMGTALDIKCVCGARIHPIVGAWCPHCGAKVVEVQEFR
jgi:hypothetical protein